jgi:plastocyanin
MKNTALVSILSGLAVLACVTPAHAKDYTVKMMSSGDKGSYYFEPRKLTIQPGETVTWVNTQDELHNVMAESIPKTAEAFTSPDLEKKDQKWSYNFKQPGTYRYHCHPHKENGMSGTIIVGKASKADEVKEVGHEHHGNHH